LSVEIPYPVTSPKIGACRMNALSQSSSASSAAPSPSTSPERSLSKGRIFSGVEACSESNPSNTSSQIASYPPHKTCEYCPERISANACPIALLPDAHAFAMICDGA
jgi:hypothetical protein